MKLVRVDTGPSPRDRTRVRLSGDIVYRDAARPPEQIWFDVPQEHADSLSATGNPWLSCLAPLAMTIGEPVELCRPVDPVLREGVEALMQVWHGWYPALNGPALIEADLLDPGEPDPSARTGAFFSGGLDSFYTLLRHQPGGDAILRHQIDDLITVWGFDVPLAASDSFESVSRQVDKVATSMGKSLVTVATNLRESGWNVTNWGLMGQAPALAAVAFALEGRYQRILLPSSLGFRSVRAWGTHPLVDPLLSTTRLALADDGALFGRIQKAAIVVQSDFAMQYLRVCWIEGSDGNCGRCEKCLRTLTIFELMGKRDRCINFPADAWSLEALSALRYRNDVDRRYMSRLSAHALERGRPDISRAIDSAVRRYDLRRAARRVIKSLSLRRAAGW